MAATAVSPTSTCDEFTKPELLSRHQTACFGSEVERTGSISKKYELKPILRWAGGKQGLIRRLIDHLPEDVASRRYVEPFVGAGSMFIAIRPEKAVLGDAN